MADHGGGLRRRKVGNIMSGADSDAGGKMTHVDSSGSIQPPPTPSSLMLLLKNRQGALITVIGAATYIALTLLTRTLFWDGAAVKEYQAAVNMEWRKQSMYAFATALLLDTLLMVFESGSIKGDAIMLPIVIKACVTITHLLINHGLGAVRIAACGSGQFVALQRYVCWAHTSMWLLFFIKSLADTPGVKDVVAATGCVVVTLCSGPASLLTSGPLSIALWINAHVFILPVLLFLHRSIRAAARNSNQPAVSRRPAAAMLSAQFPCRRHWLLWWRARRRILAQLGHAEAAGGTSCTAYQWPPSSSGNAPL